MKRRACELRFAWKMANFVSYPVNMINVIGNKGEDVDGYTGDLFVITLLWHI